MTQENPFNPNPQGSDSNDPWAGYRARREEWRAARHARREAWRAQRHARRMAWAQMWGGWHYGFNGGGPNDMAQIKAQLKEMSQAISALSDRVAVLEKLATDEDRNLAREINKLRDQAGPKEQR
jgi:hypothetical protein